MTELLRKSQIKREYGISYTTLSQWEKDGIIVAKFGILFDRDDIERAIHRTRKKGGIEKRMAGKWQY